MVMASLVRVGRYVLSRRKDSESPIANGKAGELPLLSRGRREPMKLESNSSRLIQ